jgi:hypothetical protein
MRSTRLLVLPALALVLLPLLAAESSLRFEATIPFTEGKRAPLDAKVGPVRLTSATFLSSKPGSGDKTLVNRIRGGATETQSLVRLSIEAENPESAEWEVTVTVDLLDAEGKLIDRFSKTASLEGEAKTFAVDHPVLTYVLPSIAKAALRVEARLD